MSFLRQVNTVISVLFFACYFYQLIYLLVPYLRRDKPHGETKLHRFAVLVAARNEEAVIGQLIASVKAQDYPARLITVFVAADNCTDATARIARESGAVVYERFDTAHVGKGYALDFLLRQIAGEYGDVFDAYLVLDADNLLSPEYVTAMNRVFSDGYPVVTSYRNSKNFADNWISAGYALWFLREAEFLNHARVLSGHSAAVSGTGFLFSREILRRNGGWPFHLLTEDIEFTVDCVCRGEKIGYAPDDQLRQPLPGVCPPPGRPGQSQGDPGHRQGHRGREPRRPPGENHRRRGQDPDHGRQQAHKQQYRQLALRESVSFSHGLFASSPLDTAGGSTMSKVLVSSALTVTVRGSSGKISPHLSATLSNFSGAFRRTIPARSRKSTWRTRLLSRAAALLMMFSNLF